MKIRIVGEPPRYYIDGVQLTEAEFRERAPDNTGQGPLLVEGYVKPWLGDSVAVDPTQIKEAMESARAKGVPTEFAPDGRIKWQSRDHQKRYCQAYGFYNKDENWSGRGRAPEPEPNYVDIGRD
jgi:hypothetical protein